jgi:hypothetical protein
MKKQILIVAAFIAASTTTQVTAQVTNSDALKTKTKSNNANEKTATTDAAIKLTAPSSGKVLTADEAKKTIVFRWTPIVPKPQNITYRLKVWQLMQGQSGSQAMRTNKPIVEKEMMLTETTINNIYTGPCKPPYLCDFIWTVEAIGADGKPLNDKATTEAFSFSIEKS